MTIADTVLALGGNVFYFRYWHETDFASAITDFRSWG
jgi:hypothetical protein